MATLYPHRGLNPKLISQKGLSVNFLINFKIFIHFEKNLVVSFCSETIGGQVSTFEAWEDKLQIDLITGVKCN